LISTFFGFPILVYTNFPPSTITPDTIYDPLIRPSLTNSPPLYKKQPIYYDKESFFYDSYYISLASTILAEPATLKLRNFYKNFKFTNYSDLKESSQNNRTSRFKCLVLKLLKLEKLKNSAKSLKFLKIYLK